MDPSASDTRRDDPSGHDTGNAGTQLTAYSAFVPALPLREAAERYAAGTGVAVDVNAGRPEQWMPKLEAGAPADLICCGAEFLLDVAESKGLLVPGTRRSVGRRRAGIVVPAGNPAGIGGLDDMTAPGVRVGVAVEGCTLGLWDEISGREALTGKIRARITARANGCGALLGRVSRREVDAAFGWANMDRVPEMAVEVVPLPEALQVVRSTGVGQVRGAAAPDAAGRFIEWLTSAEARAIYRKWGWEPSAE